MHGPSVIAVHRSDSHSFSKFAEESIELVAGLGVRGDAHAGVTIQHRSRIARDANQHNLRQVHLLHAELFDELIDAGFALWPGELGENVTTRGLDLLSLPVGSRLTLGEHAVVELTGLRNPCSQIDRFHNGLMAAVLNRDAEGKVVRKTGVMGIVLAGGIVCPGDPIQVLLPALPHQLLQPV